MKTIQKISLLLVSLLSLSGCAENFPKVHILECNETTAFFANYPKDNKQIFQQSKWDNEVYPELLSRSSGYLELPTLDDGNPVTFTNTLSQQKYGETNVYSLQKDDSFEKVVLFLHGGAYAFNIQVSELKYCDALCTQANAKIVMPLYGLLPQVSAPEVYPVLSNIYEDILLYDKPVYIVGDSSGGGLALGFTQFLKELNKKMPTKIVLISPWLDATLSNNYTSAFEETDVMLSSYGLCKCGEIWSGTYEVNDYKVSPINGTFKGLPEVMLFGSTKEIFYPDINYLYEGLKQQNTFCTFVIGEGFIHSFPMFTELREFNALLNDVVVFIR